MRHSLFVCIWKVVEQHDEYFVQKRNAAAILGLSSLQKVIVALRMLSYGVAADIFDEYVRIAESTAIESLRRFVTVVVEIFGGEYLREHNEVDTARLLANGGIEVFPVIWGRLIVCIGRGKIVLHHIKVCTSGMCMSLQLY
jgi:hypothetical protein